MKNINILERKKNIPPLKSLYGSYHLVLLIHFEQKDADSFGLYHLFFSVHFEQKDADTIGLYSVPSVLLAKESRTLKQCKSKLCKFELAVTMKLLNFTKIKFQYTKNVS